jgi:purine-nucleoside/S-methyl-5'-thioadenosine phosphorylase / adenosine deaminase
MQPMTARAPAAAGLRQYGGLPVLTWPVFDPLPVDVLVTTRQAGVSAGRYATLNLSFAVGDDPALVRVNRSRAAAALGADLADLVFAEQVHGSHAQIVTAADRGRGALATAGPPPTAGPLRAAGPVGPADALVTTEPGLVLTILVADCVPVVLYDPTAHVLACVHAGWRGTVARVTAAAVAAMESLGSRPEQVIAGIGPAIGADRYQVGEDVAGAVRAAFGPDAGRLLTAAGPGRWQLDLAAANRCVLYAAGVPDGQIHQTGLATGPDPGLFFSHRAGPPCGRFALLARLRPQGAA